MGVIMHFIQEIYNICFWVMLVIDTVKEMVTHSSTLAWQIPWTEVPGRLQSMGSLRVGHD